MHQLLKDKELSIKDIVGLILDYGKKLNSSVKMKASLFNYIEEKVSPKSNKTDKKRSIDEESPKDNRGEKMSSFKRRRKVKTNLNCFSHTRRT
uniref:Uncharacterized protein n=1 Tax=Arion vulgaris TaxID=1028688 RepID=A0A0B7B6H5_9EUPU